MGAEKKDNEIISLLKENLETSKEILKLSQYIRKYVFWQKVFNWLKFFLILIPILLAIIYLPPFLKGALEPLQGLIYSVEDVKGLIEK